MRSRIITASILIAGVIWIVFFASATLFDIFIGLFLGLASWEWGNLVPCPLSVHRRGDNKAHLYSLNFIKSRTILWKILLVLFVESLWIVFSTWRVGFHGLLYFNTVLLLLLIPALLTYPRTVPRWYSAASVVMLGISFLVTASVSLQYLKHYPQGNLWLITTLLLTWMTDTGAYFSGRFWGRRKFMPLVSPNKTWEGFFGGGLLSELLVIGFGVQFAANVMGWGWWLLAGTLAICGAVVGDLFISMLKRCAQVKDTGFLLPGHGGILDRVDSLLVSSTIIALFLMGVR